MSGAGGGDDGEHVNARIRVPKTSEIVARQIRGQIIRGEIGEGDFLPPEGQLMASLGISRPTLREAFRILEAENLISVVRGARTGAKVHAPKVDLVSRYAGYVLQTQETSVRDIFEARLAIEPYVVRGLAARGKGSTDSLVKAVARMRALMADERYEDFLVAVAEFHHVLVAAGGNQTLEFMNRMLIDLLARHHIENFRRGPLPLAERLKLFDIALRSYDKLIRLIEAGDEEGAVDHWRRHLLAANNNWDRGGDRIVDGLGESPIRWSGL
jgi:DNA-binding FadR family transcriptional regulator